MKFHCTAVLLLTHACITLAFIAPPPSPFGFTSKTSSSTLRVTTPDAPLSDAEARLKAIDDMERAERAQGNAVLAGKEEETDSGGRPFPLSMVVGQDNIKQALLFSAVNPQMGGVVISGGRGTAKSIMARALHRLLPPIEVLKGSQFNIHPEGEDGMDDFLKTELLNPDATPLSERETEIIEPPFVQVPLNVMEDRLLGSVDVEKSVQTGKTVFQPGLLAKAHRGILYIDDINLLDAELANIVLNIITTGYVIVEREGVSVRYPCKPLLIATFNPEEGELRDHLLDRIAVSLSADATPLTLEERVEASGAVLDFSASGKGRQANDGAETALKEAEENEDDLKTAIIFAREYMKELSLLQTQKVYLCEEAIRAGTQGHRAELFATEVARASAALEGRQVTADDLKIAVKLAIAPRGTFIQTPEDMMDMPPPPPPPPPPPQMDDEMDKDQEEEERENEEDQEEQEEEEQDQPDEPLPDTPQEFMFDIDATPIDPDLINFQSRSRSGKGGGNGLIFSQDRGRYIKPQLPKGKVVRLAVDATLRAAAPYQKARRARAVGTEREGRGVFIEGGDTRTKKMARKAGSLIIFVVDASGSMAMNRMDAAKGAAMSLLTEAYQSRDQVCLITFQGEQAEVLLPPTKSISMTKKRLETMPCGGGSPLADALQRAQLTGMNAQKTGDVGKVVVVCISDGRANVPLCTSNGEEFNPDDDENNKGDGKPSRQYLKDEVIACAKQLGVCPGFNLLMVNSESKFVSTGLAKEVADAAGGKYHLITGASADAISGVAKQAMAALKE
ncbi:hypothetical protein TrVE_jg2499 [Triparma verrucosa]|uniref:Mg-protoporphyrin IX chelatase n=1 Tax=Triparma verrucosa TaxID=1606542 RepID=A0A9W7EXI1_9STRA|nr:hypothetical protein TrVE_jg2499 [Triparma verrucosa]